MNEEVEIGIISTGTLAEVEYDFGKQLLVPLTAIVVRITLEISVKESLPPWSVNIM
jgi:hypothetical protein